MNSIRLANVTFAYPQQVSLITSCTLELRPGWTGIVGRNGAGKSTLLDLLEGSLQPSIGRVERGDLTIARCHQPPATQDEVTEFATSWSSAAMRWMSLLALEPEDYWRWETLSPGTRRKWQIGAALARDPAVLLLDEPTNHLDSAGRDVLVGALRRYDGIGVVVSHDRRLLEALCEGTMRLHRGDARLYPGPYSAARQLWCAEEQAALEHLETTQALAGELEDQLAARSSRHAGAVGSLSTRSRMSSVHDSDARSAMAKGRARRAEASLAADKRATRAELERVRDELSELSRPESGGGNIFIDAEPCRRAVALSYCGPVRVANRTLIEHIDISLRRDERVWLRGANGCGKSTLIRAALASCDLPAERVLYVPQQLEAPTAREAFDSLAHADRSRALQIGAAINLDARAVLDGTSLSPGEVRKLQIAVGLVGQPWLIVLDEPTNNLDLGTVERLEAALSDYPGALLLVTHDERFAEALAVAPRDLP